MRGANQDRDREIPSASLRAISSYTRALTWYSVLSLHRCGRGQRCNVDVVVRRCRSQSVPMATDT
jgi:hypothetical protein